MMPQKELDLIKDNIIKEINSIGESYRLKGGEMQYIMHMLYMTFMTNVCNWSTDKEWDDEVEHVNLDLKKIRNVKKEV